MVTWLHTWSTVTGRRYARFSAEIMSERERERECQHPSLWLLFKAPENGPADIYINLHMNNGVLMELSQLKRWDLIKHSHESGRITWALWRRCIYSFTARMSVSRLATCRSIRSRHLFTCPLHLVFVFPSIMEGLSSSAANSRVIRTQMGETRQPRWSANAASIKPLAQVSQQGVGKRYGGGEHHLENIRRPCRTWLWASSTVGLDGNRIGDKSSLQHQTLSLLLLLYINIKTGQK